MAKASIRIEEMEQKLNGIQDEDKEIGTLLKKGLEKPLGLDLFHENGSLEEKRKIPGSIFSENFTFDGTQHRTIRINEVQKSAIRKTASCQIKK